MAIYPTPNTTDHHRQVLGDLVNLGHELAQILVATARTAAAQAADAAPNAPPPTDIPALADAFDRVARSVRRSVLLIQSLDRPAPAQAALAPQIRTAARTQIIRAIEDHINNESGGAEADALHAELRERLDRPEFDDEIATRPVADIITDIERDLDLGNFFPGSRRFKRRTPAEIAILHDRAAAPPGAASRPEFAIAFPPKPPVEDRFEANKHLALMLAGTRTRGK